MYQQLAAGLGNAGAVPGMGGMPGAGNIGGNYDLSQALLGMQQFAGAQGVKHGERLGEIGRWLRGFVCVCEGLLGRERGNLIDPSFLKYII